MARLLHIRVERPPTSEQYTYPHKVKGVKFRCPLRDRAIHARHLKQQFHDVVAGAAALHPGEPEDAYSIIVEFQSDPGLELCLDSLENRGQGIEVACVRKADDTSLAIVRVPPGKMPFFLRRVDEYEKENTRFGKPRNDKLVRSIAGVRLAALRSFWTDVPSLFPQDDQAVWWEAWLRCPRGDEGDPVMREFRQQAGHVLRLDFREVRFEERAVLLAWGTPRDWGSRLTLMDSLAELRKAKEPAGPYVELAPAEQAEFVRDLLSRVTAPPDNAPAVCILDTGVAWGHPLLSVGMDPSSALTVNPDWQTHDHDGHGTEVAGLGLYGPLAELLAGTDPVALSHRIESVKILPPHGANDPENYGAITQEAVARAEVAFARRSRSVCMAVTADDRDQGYPSLWSAAIDQMCSGEIDDHRLLMFICGGNLGDLQDAPAEYRYPHTNRTRGIEDPAQSWNAVTVGAYTDMVLIHAADRQGWRPVAPKGRLCPTSRTSVSWGHECPIKPDIVMEGGNWGVDGLGRYDQVDDLSLLTTARPDSRRLLTTFGDTSAAVVLAARMGAQIQGRYPDYWPETVRGLLIHSAEWTPEMLAEFPNTQREDRLRCYGWGVPRLEKALWSAKNAVTLIFQGELQPYDKDKGRVKTKDMHIHALPWPVDVLQQFPAATVRMRVTLSYFIEPSPGRQGRTRRHRYQSHGLRFDVKRPLESPDDFRGRLSREAQEEEQEELQEEQAGPTGEPLPWALGRNLRARGSIHSDWWQGSASALAASGYIGVFPVTGWWRERSHLQRWNRSARYSLIVSLETPRTDIDIYTAIATQVGITPQIEV